MEKTIQTPPGSGVPGWNVRFVPLPAYIHNHEIVSQRGWTRVNNLDCTDNVSVRQAHA